MLFSQSIYLYTIVQFMRIKFFYYAESYILQIRNFIFHLNYILSKKDSDFNAFVLNMS